MSSLELHLELAQLAYAYAHSFVVHGCSDLENNDFPAEYFNALDTGLLTQVRGLVKQLPTDPYNLLEQKVYHYEKVVWYSKKYSLGNCYELTHLAMDYFFINSIDPLIAVEIIEINGHRGDHVFLVIGRNPNSNTQDILSWGDTAVICDPWAGRVYAANQYQQQLKTFYRSIRQNGTKVNCTMDYNPAIHRLDVLLTIEHVRQYLADAPIELSFLKQLDLIENTLFTYQKKINKRCVSLAKKYTQDDLKYQIVKEKVEAIAHLLLAVDSLKKSKPEVFNELSSRTVHYGLRKKLNLLYNELNNIISTTDNNYCVLSDYRHPSYPVNRLRTSLGFFPTTKQCIDKANSALVQSLTPKQ